ncbi:unnamed protein product [Lasius platythorax]|uniref:DDE Tnp4 domain-containing protein n=1 Tax=Lasius platythorax TaxID=488582 RepID=A0AAV2MWJ9_9HYME
MELYLHRLKVRINNPATRPHRIEGFIERVVDMSTASEFQSHFRVTVTSFQWLLNRIAPLLESTRAAGHQTTDPKRQLLAFLWLLATPNSFRSVGSRFDLGKSTLSAIFMRVVTALNEISPEIIFWPNIEQRQRIALSFQASAGIEGIVGAIDDCFAGYPSRVSDIRIFRNSPIYEEFMNHPNNYFDEKQFIIGDKAYPVLQWCIPPYIERRNVTTRQKHFNTCHAKSRQIVERCFALLFGRFRRLKYLDMNRTDFIAPTIIAACVLHNICLNNQENQEIRDMFIDEGLQAVMNNAGNVNHEAANYDNVNAQELGREGHALRDRIAENLYPF